MKDTIYRADAIEAIQNTYCKPCKERGDDHNEVVCRACNFDDAMGQIDALPSAEAVSREEYDALYKRWVEAEQMADYYDIDGDDETAIKALSAEAVHGWIPCSEKLPSESGWYVISVVGLKNITDVSYFYSDESKWSDVSHTQTVTAWMPLPTPYKGGDDDD